MRELVAVTALIALLGSGTAASANVFNLGPGLTNLETVRVGDPGNVGELSGPGAGGYGGPDRICGAVAYTYNIGKYEVTAAQYTDFLNKVAKTDTYGLYNSCMSNPSGSWGCNVQRTGNSGNYSYTVASEWANRPVNYVSFWDACRFANWLGHGQPTGLQSTSTTERGAYTLDGYIGSDGRAIQRNAGAKWAVTSEDEWYKAAYYKGGGTNAGYWDYSTNSDTAPSNVGSDGYADPGNHANYWNGGYTIGNPYYRTNVGEFENSASAYGTFDQGGNVFEWNEAVLYPDPDYVFRGERGGGFGDGCIQASYRDGDEPSREWYCGGFRLSQVPEPSSLLALLGGLAGLIGLRRRRP
jgi:formylglycine-generating enzyme required for sulfatase activity